MNNILEIDFYHFDDFGNMVYEDEFLDSLLKKLGFSWFFLITDPGFFSSILGNKDVIKIDPLNYKSKAGYVRKCINRGSSACIISCLSVKDIATLFCAENCFGITVNYIEDLGEGIDDFFAKEIFHYIDGLEYNSMAKSFIFFAHDGWPVIVCDFSSLKELVGS